MVVKSKPVTLGQMAKCESFVAQPDWVRGPCSKTMVSDILLRANFDAACARLAKVDPDFTTWETIQWDHFGVGYVEDIFTKPGSEAHKAALDMEHDLSYYPCLDDELLGEMMEKEEEEELAAKAAKKEPKLITVISEPAMSITTIEVGGEG